MNPESKQTFRVINEMVTDGVFESYAVAGAIGAMFYVEPFSTEDIDIFVLTREEAARDRITRLGVSESPRL